MNKIAIIFLLIFSSNILFATIVPATSSNEPQAKKILLYDNFQKTCDDFLKVNNYSEIISFSKNSASYFERYIFYLLKKFLKKDYPLDALITLEDKVPAIIKLGETAKGNHYLFDIWIQYSSWTNQEKKLKLKTDESLKQHAFTKAERETIYLSCLDAYQKINDIPSIIEIKLLLFNLNSNEDYAKNFLKEIYKSKEFSNTKNISDNTTRYRAIKALKYLNKGEFQKALEEINTAEKEYESLGDILNKSRMQLQKGNIYSKTGYYSKALDNFKESLKVFKESGYAEEQASISMSLGNLYLRQNNPKNALSYFKDAKNIYSKIKDLPGQAKVLNNLGVAYDGTQAKEDAKKSYKESMKIADKIQDLRQQAETGNNLGNLYLKNKEIPKAISAYKKAIKACKKSNSLEVEIQAMHNLGLAYFFSSKPSEAIANLTESLTLSRRSGQDSDAMESSFLLGKIYLQKKNNNKAKIFLDISLDLAKKLNRNEKHQEIKKLIENIK